MNAQISMQLVAWFGEAREDNRGGLIGILGTVTIGAELYPDQAAIIKEVIVEVTKFIGKRMLLKVSGAAGFYKNDKIEEYKIIEISPSGNWIKLQNLYGNKYWKALTDVQFVEELKNFKADRPID